MNMIINIKSRIKYNTINYNSKTKHRLPKYRFRIIIKIEIIEVFYKTKVNSFYVHYIYMIERNT